MKKTILVAGGSGLLGSFFSKALQKDGHEVRILTRSSNLAKSDGNYQWDPNRGTIDQAALAGVNVVINLAGAGIADKRWSTKRKAVLWDSRIDTTEFLLKQIQVHNLKIECYIGASASGVYGDRGDEILTEESQPGEPQFLVDLSNAWEKAHHAFARLADRVICLRIGVVLAKEGGALPKLKNSVVLGIGAYLGNGTQYLPWIHIEDLSAIVRSIIENEQLTGVVNAVAPNPETNYRFTKHIADLSWGPGWLFPIPKIFLRLGLGEMSNVLLFSQRVIPQKLTRHNFKFRYPDLRKAIENLMK